MRGSPFILCIMALGISKKKKWKGIGFVANVDVLVWFVLRAFDGAWALRVEHSQTKRFLHFQIWESHGGGSVFLFSFFQPRTIFDIFDVFSPRHLTDFLFDVYRNMIFLLFYESYLIELVGVLSQLR